ncbi:AAEL003849-PA [Aedes aegypti]|uniref:AAEL003849-PA n=1 Tax=Aedes aegypti TaxID=7159 RepID=Q17EE5_AEDAE|nr:AAEL003849-PA [Aedes aegypti]
MKSITTLCLAVVCFIALLSVGAAAPQESVSIQDAEHPAEFDTDIQKVQHDQARQIPVEFQRRKRISCDLLSGLGWGHSICAGHCLAISWRYRGGYCNDQGVCVCRT